MRESSTLSGSEWTMDDLLAIEQICARHAERYGLDTFPNQMEVITSEQMLDAYVSSGLPVNYGHWSFGKHFLIESGKYRSGANALAYEIVLNTNPCIAFLMESNSLAMQALVIPHACFGHNSFSKGNYLFQQWTQPDAVLRLHAVRPQLCRRLRGALWRRACRTDSGCLARAARSGTR